MNSVRPLAAHAGARLVTFAEDQPEYQALPASVDGEGLVMTEWELTSDELERIVRGGRVRLWVYTFGRALQPVQLEVAEPPKVEG